MSAAAAAANPPRRRLEKAPTDIPGFDEITGGGLPRGRVTLIIGGPGTGKTVFAHTATRHEVRRRRGADADSAGNGTPSLSRTAPSTRESER